MKIPSRNPSAQSENPSVKQHNSGKARRSSKKSRSRARRKDPTDGLPPVNLNAAAIDIGGSEHWAAIPPGRAEESVRRFGCVTAELEAMVQWFKENNIETVVMEATGNYWVVLYDLLEQNQLNPVVVNPRYAKNMSGRKGDIPDCQWMQKLHTFGLFSNSFRPEEPFRILRTYLRQRETLVVGSSQAIHHMQKALTEMNVQLANVISDISGETGLRIIEAILSGQRDPEALAELKNSRIRASHARLAQALEGHWKQEQLFVLEQAYLTFLHYQEQVTQTQERIEKQIRAIESCAVSERGEASESPTQNSEQTPRSEKLDLGQEIRRIAGVDVSQIDGIGPVHAMTIISEVGVDMSPWPTEKRFSSWLGLCPDHRVSGGKILGRSTRPVVSRARNAFRMAAYSLERSQSWLGAKYRRLKRRLGAPKAITAMAHHLARLFYRLVKLGEEYVDKGMKAYEEKYRQQRIKWLQKQAKDLNLELTEIEPVAA
jgi:transposase